MTWTPSNDFEDEIIGLQPDHDLIFANYEERETSYPRPEKHLLYAAAKKQQAVSKGKHKHPTEGVAKRNQKQRKPDEQLSSVDQQKQKFNAICKLNEITRTKPLGQLPSINDWNTEENLERETIALMRNMGMESCVDQPLDEQRTLATHPITKDVIVMKNGQKRIPIFFGKKFFELKPKECNNSSSEVQAENSSSLADASFNLYESSNSSDSSDQIHYVKIQESQSLGNSPQRGIVPSTSEESFKSAEEPENSNEWSRKKNEHSKSSRSLLQQQFFTPREIYEKKRKNLIK